MAVQLCGHQQHYLHANLEACSCYGVGGHGCAIALFTLPNLGCGMLCRLSLLYLQPHVANKTTTHLMCFMQHAQLAHLIAIDHTKFQSLKTFGIKGHLTLGL